MVCKKCNKTLDYNNQFCPNCGFSVEKTIELLVNDKKKQSGYLKELKVLSEEEKLKVELDNIISGIYIFISATILLLSSLLFWASNTNPKVIISNLTFPENINTLEKTKINDIDEALLKLDSINSIECDTLEGTKSIAQEIKAKTDINTVNLCDLSETVAYEVGRVFTKVFSGYDNINGYLNNIEISNKYNDIVLFVPFVKTINTSYYNEQYPLVLSANIYLNKDFYTNINENSLLINYISNENYYINNATPYSLIAHELGHYLLYVALIKNNNVDNLVLINDVNRNKLVDVSSTYNNEVYAKQIVEKAYKDYKSSHPYAEINISEFRLEISNLSYLSESSYSETIAEAFHDFYVNSYQASYASIAIISELNGRLGD